MVKVGLTGGIASGKSTVCGIFSRLGARVLDTDILAREAVTPGRPAWIRLREKFGPEFFHLDGSLDRRSLRILVFRDPEKRQQLNEAVHPEVMRAVREWLEAAAHREPHGVLLVDIPLLVEVGAVEGFDRIMLVFVREEIQLARLMARDRVSLDEARGALAAQMPLREKLAFADYVVDNSGSLAETQVQVEAVWRELLSQAHVGAEEEAATRGDGDGEKA
ncbi:MAG TPA: dephospho-CoA kinase [Syntrophobacteria bacterium]|nr:dephospho-CoA kinase [Syntrophobacteria bacterium]